MAFITDIKRFAVHDGDGIRTTVFLRMSIAVPLVPQPGKSGKTDAPDVLPAQMPGMRKMCGNMFLP